MSALLECVVCLEGYAADKTKRRRPMSLPCGHSLCESCLADCDKCPLDRKAFAADAVNPNYALLDALHIISAGRQSPPPQLAPTTLAARLSPRRLARRPPPPPQAPPAAFEDGSSAVDDFLLVSADDGVISVVAEGSDASEQWRDAAPPPAAAAEDVVDGKDAADARDSAVRDGGDEEEAVEPWRRLLRVDGVDSDEEEDAEAEEKPWKETATAVGAAIVGGLAIAGAVAALLSFDKGGGVASRRR
eukprot:PLAT5591.1.p1 GENE.PLAT5591.1~~PLAT5591.1.p1  ORF type:complete len:246 (+),score=75.53 PLAT5591.1:76-813(+)